MAGPIEKARAARLLKKVQQIDVAMSQQIEALKLSRKVGPFDKHIFGTGDLYGIETFTSDAKFISAARSKGVNLRVYVHPTYSFQGL